MNTHAPVSILADAAFAPAGRGTFPGLANATDTTRPTQGRHPIAADYGDGRER